MFGIITGWRKEITETEMQSPWLDSYPGTFQLVVSILTPMLWGAYLNYIFRVILYQSFPFRFYFLKEQCHRIQIQFLQLLDLNKTEKKLCS